MKILKRVDPGLYKIIEGYLYNFLKQHYWKVSTIMEWDDALQEGWYTLCIMEKRLTSSHKDITIETPSQYMACFKICWSRHFITLSNRDTKYKVVATESDFGNPDSESEIDFLLSDLVTDVDLGYIECVLEQAPSEVQAVLNLIFKAPKEVLEALSKAFKKDVLSNQVLCSALGFDPNQVDLTEETFKYLSNL